MPEPIEKRLAIAAGLGTLYLIWGSTYLGIRIAIDTLPPLVMAGSRFLLAGLPLYAFLRWRARSAGDLARQASRPTPAQWRSATLIGALLVVGGNGGVTVAQQYVPTSVAALIVATVPIWMVLLDSLVFRRTRPRALVWCGVAAGIGGIVVLVGPGLAELSGAATLPSLLILAAALSWASGSLLSRSRDLPSSPLLAAAMQMIAGGLLLLLAATLHGDWPEVAWRQISPASLAAMLYLAGFGSALALSVYNWLLRHCSAATVATYAFVNPIVAVALGVLFLDEALDARVLTSTELIVFGVVLILWGQRARQASPKQARTAPTTARRDAAPAAHSGREAA